MTLGSGFILENAESLLFMPANNFTMHLHGFMDQPSKQNEMKYFS